MTTLDMLRRARWISLLAAMAMTPSALTGCAPADDDMTAGDDDVALVGEIANVQQSAVKRQSIGNCWLYATVGWAESMHKARTNTEINISESYLTFWDWFAKINTDSGFSSKVETSGDRMVTRREIRTGGSWQLGTQIIRQRGFMMEGDFIPEEATSEMSSRQSAAQAVINTALSDGGELATREARRDGARVLSVLARAWNLRPEMVTTLTSVFGTRGEKRFDGYSTRAQAGRTTVRTAASLQVRTHTRSGGTIRSIDTTLFEVLPGGRYAWVAFDYPGSWGASQRPEYMRRMLRALNADAPVIVSWLVDFNALDNTGAFRTEQLTMAGRPGRQGGHLTVLHDYQTRLADGTVFRVGQSLTPAERERALTGTVEFLQVKNSWGVSRSDRASQAGYYNLYLNYLHGPIAWTNEANPMGPTTPQTPLNEMIIPQGF
jgi:hypothetical protein